MFEKIRVFVFDLDGVIWLGEKVIESALETVTVLKNLGYLVFYMTNNSSRKRQEIIQKLNRLGFRSDTSNTCCSPCAMADYLTENNLLSVYVVGTESLNEELISYGIETGCSNTASAVAVGLDPSFSYEKITIALQAIENGARLVVANVDPHYPAGNGRILPGCGAMVGAIVGASGHQPDFVVGKPNTYMLKLLCREYGLSPEEICVVGDMPESDMAMADNFRCLGILYDPKNVHEAFSGIRVKNPCEIISLVEWPKGRMRDEQARISDG